jgi:serine/threonine-protein phosphatase 2A activator
MYNVEVLSKFPVVQHFPFGSLFSFSADPNAKTIQASVHTASQPKSSTPSTTAPTARPGPQPGLRDPMAEPARSAERSGGVGTAAPWASAGARTTGVGMPPMTAAPWATAGAGARGAGDTGVPSGPNQPTKAPWLSRTPAPPPTAGGGTTAPWARENAGAQNAQPSTRAPWADKR